MKFRTLGMSGLRVSAVGLGCMGMSHAYGKPADKKDMTELLACHTCTGCLGMDDEQETVDSAYSRLTLHLSTEGEYRGC